MKTNITEFKVYYFLGKIHEKNKKYRKALIDYEAVLKLHPHFLKIHNDLARVNEKLENYQDAIKYYENCLSFMGSPEGAKIVKNKIKSLKKQLKKK